MAAPGLLSELPSNLAVLLDVHGIGLPDLVGEEFALTFKIFPKILRKTICLFSITVNYDPFVIFDSGVH